MEIVVHHCKAQAADVADAATVCRPETPVQIAGSPELWRRCSKGGFRQAGDMLKQVSAAAILAISCPQSSLYMLPWNHLDLHQPKSWHRSKWAYQGPSSISHWGNQVEWENFWEKNLPSQEKLEVLFRIKIQFKQSSSRDQTTYSFTSKHGQHHSLTTSKPWQQSSMQLSVPRTL